MVSGSIPQEDLDGMSFEDLRKQKSYLEENIPTFYAELQEIQKGNLNRINRELNERYMKYGVIASVGLIIGMVAIRKLK